MSSPDDIPQGAIELARAAVIAEVSPNYRHLYASGRFDDHAAIRAAARAIVAERSRAWQPIATAPRDGTAFLAYGCYLYPGDKDVTEYIEIIEYSGDDEWPWEGQGEKSKPDVFSHWMPLPAPPSAEAR